MDSTTRKQIIRWHENGIGVDECAPLIPQYCRQEIEAVIKDYRKEKEWDRMTRGSRR